MKAFKIDVIKQDIYEVDIPDDSGDDSDMTQLNAIYSLLECDTIELFKVKDRDFIYVDERALLKPVKIGGFYLDFENSSLPGHPAIGHGLVLSTDSDGREAPPEISLEELKKVVRFFRTTNAPMTGTFGVGKAKEE